MALVWLASAAAAQTAPAPPPRELPPSLQERFDEGVVALKAGRLDEAEAAFQAVVAGGGGVSSYVHNNLGIVAQERGDHAQAVLRFRQAVRLDPAYVAPRILLGASLLALGRVDEARGTLERAVKLAPKEPLARLQLARVEERAGRWPAAVAQYRALRQLKPEDPEAVYALGSAYLHLSEWSLGELRDLPGGKARLYQAQGHNLRVQGRPDLALTAFEHAAQADPTLPEVHLAMAQLHLEQRRFAEARREIERELLVVPESAGARALAAQLRTAEGGTP
ncbi:MAG TPA: tetratricopeptide repeat protein [Vicinamibacteria bacterium]|nr:tetratricopeptide repeat protein [Vicinamibacteria bacterium]